MSAMTPPAFVKGEEPKVPAKTRSTIRVLIFGAPAAPALKAVRAALPGGSGKGVRALVIGALGRCGRGAVDLFRKIGLEE